MLMKTKDQCEIEIKNFFDYYGNSCSNEQFEKCYENEIKELKFRDIIVFKRN